jgi:hypothetical protein
MRPASVCRISRLRSGHRVDPLLRETAPAQIGFHLARDHKGNARSVRRSILDFRVWLSMLLAFGVLVLPVPPRRFLLRRG